MKPTLPDVVSHSNILFAYSEHTLDSRKESVVFWEICDEASEGPSDHGVLAHQDDRVAAQGLANLVHLFLIKPYP